MEDIRKITEKIIECFESIIEKCDADVESAFEAMDRIVNGSDQTPQKSKKKAKRLSVIADTESEDSLRSEKDVSSRKPSQKDVPFRKLSEKDASSRKSLEKDISSKKPLEKDVSSRESSARPPVPVAISVENPPEDKETRTSSRPVRAAKTKIENCLREQPINTKLRRPSTTTLDEHKPQIKEEKRSDASSGNVKQKKIKENVSKSNVEPIKRKSSEKDGENKAEDVEEPSKKVDESLVILNNNEQLTVELSDDEGEKMPPPAVIPKKRNARRRQERSSESILEVPRLNGIKIEKQSVERKSDKTETTKNESGTSKTDAVSVKKEKISDGGKSSASNEKVAQTKGKKGRKQKHRPIKEEKIDNDGDDKNIKEKNTGTASEGEKIRQSARNKKTSIESVYEDAISENGKDNTSNPNTAVQDTKSLKMNQEVIDTNPEKAADATFLSAVDAPFTQSPKDAIVADSQCTFIMENRKDTSNDVGTENRVEKDVHSCNDQTFTSNIGQTTFVMNKEGNQEIKTNVDPKKCEAITSANPCNDVTFRINSSEGENQKENKNTENNSILTDDESDDESEEDKIPIPTRVVRAKNKNELFNPFIQSPVKKKVEAFEKHASAAYGTPAQQRQTRLKTRSQRTKENKEPSQLPTSKVITPNLVRNLRLLTPTQQSNIVSSFGNSGLRKPTANSTSKLIFPKPTTVNKPTSHSRDSSTEDMKKGYKLQELEEKKKKREQKQQMAMQIREAKQKERTDKLKKALEEREEKQRRKAIEAEQKRHLEEINRNLKVQEEKREAQKRLEKQKQIEMAEAARKEREILDAMKIQKAKEKILQERRLLEQKRMLRKPQQPAYHFTMLNSDDSTDEEGKTSSKRPPPPMWSKSAVRQLIIERQSHLPTKITDSFFSVQPMTPDLRQIFPTIESRYLKRNSSVFWRTPPRYSQLPKY